MNRRALGRRLVGVTALAAVLAMVVGGCSTSSGSSGPDLAKELSSVPALHKLSTPPEGLDVTGSDGVWESDGSTTETADLIAAKAPADERSSGGSDQFLLYPSGTLWISEHNGKSEVVLYNDNDDAYRRHSGVLLASAGWGNRMSGYSSGGGSNNGSSGSGNGFRGGGSGSGK